MTACVYEPKSLPQTQQSNFAKIFEFRPALVDTSDKLLSVLLLYGETQSFCQEVYEYKNQCCVDKLLIAQPLKRF